MHITQDQVSNFEHKAATIIGTAMVTYAQSNPHTAYTDILTYVGGALVAWAAVKSNTLNKAPNGTATTATTETSTTATTAATTAATTKQV